MNAYLDNRNALFVIILFIIYPLGAFPFIVYEVLRYKKYAFFLLAIFMGLWSMYYFPWADQNRYFNLFESYRDILFVDLFDFTDISIYYKFNLVQIFLFLISHLGLNFEICRFFFVVFSYLIIFSVYRDIIGPSPSTSLLKIHKYTFLLLFFVIPFHSISEGFRTGLAACLFVKGFYLIYYKDNAWGWFFLLLSFFVHFFIFVFVLWVVLDKTILPLLNKKMLPILCFFAFVFGSILFYKILSLFSFFDFFEFLLNGNYVSGKYGMEYDGDLGAVVLTYIVVKIPLFISIYCFYLVSRKENISNSLFYLILILSLSFYYQTIFYRFSIVSMILFVVYYLFIAKKRLFIAKIPYFALLVSLICSFFIPYYAKRHYHLLSDEYEILYSPLPVILFHSYDLGEVNALLDENGDL